MTPTDLSIAGLRGSVRYLDQLNPAMISCLNSWAPYIAISRATEQPATFHWLTRKASPGFDISVHETVTEDGTLFRVQSSIPTDSDTMLFLLRGMRAACVCAAVAERGTAAAHGAVVSFMGNAVILVGRKGAGKTTIMIECLRHGASLVSNDKFLIRQSPDATLLAHGIPNAVKVVEKYADAHLFSLAHGAEVEKLHIWPKRFALSYGTTAQSHAPVRAVIKLSHDPGGSEPRPAPLSRIDASDLLDEYLSPGFHPKLAVLLPKFRDRIEKLVRKVPMYTLTGNLGLSGPERNRKAVVEMIKEAAVHGRLEY